MSTSHGSWSLFRKTFAAFLLAPVHFLLLQIPAASVELISDFFLPEGDLRIPLAILILFPYLCITSTLSAALTFSSVLDSQNGTKLSLKESWKRLSGKMGIVVPVSLTTGLILILGLLTVFVMLFHYMAIYLFVPHLIVTEPKLPWSVYLHRSKKLIRGSYFTAVIVVSLMLILSLGGDILVGIVSYVFAPGDSLLVRSLLTALKYGFSVTTTALMAIAISFYFLSRRERP